jgi:hypothetical protein
MRSAQLAPTQFRVSDRQKRGSEERLLLTCPTMLNLKERQKKKKAKSEPKKRNVLESKASTS